MFEFLQDFLHYDSLRPMLFGSGQFLFFFTLVFLFYVLLYPTVWLRTLYLLAVSLFFYYKSSGWHVLLLAFCIVFNFGLGRIMELQAKQAKKRLMWLGIGVNLSFLLYFKYTNFFLGNAYNLFGADFQPLNIFLPIGISFFTFQTISYLVDIYRGHIRACANILDFGFYLSFFPQLVAGPIVRASDFLPQIRRRIEYLPGVRTLEQNPKEEPETDESANRIDTGQLGEAMFMILKGFVKKALIADYIAQYADLVFANPSGFSAVENWVAMYAYALQIYCDFSGYSDMAIGLALLFGFKLLDNFRSPYQSLNITEFWRRWHISLSFWLRDYVYISLGGNRRGTFNRYLFLLITMLVGGFWHGASWKFVFWGAMHGLALIVHKLWTDYVLRGKVYQALPLRALSWLLTFHFVAFLWIFFRADNFELAVDMIRRMFTDFDPAYWQALWAARPLVMLLLLLGLAAHFIPRLDKERAATYFSTLPVPLKALVFLVVIQLSLQLQSAEVQPFIYFQF